jgi:hypothetical protein
MRSELFMIGIVSELERKLRNSKNIKIIHEFRGGGGA